MKLELCTGSIHLIAERGQFAYDRCADIRVIDTLTTTAHLTLSPEQAEALGHFLLTLAKSMRAAAEGR